MTEELEAGGGKWSAFLLAAAAVVAGHNVRVAWPVGSAPKGDCLGCLDARGGLRRWAKVFRHGVLVRPTRACCGKTDAYWPAAPGSRPSGNAISRIV